MAWNRWMLGSLLATAALAAFYATTVLLLVMHVC